MKRELFRIKRHHQPKILGSLKVVGFVTGGRVGEQIWVQEFERVYISWLLIVLRDKGKVTCLKCKEDRRASLWRLR